MTPTQYYIKCQQTLADLIDLGMKEVRSDNKTPPLTALFHLDTCKRAITRLRGGQK